VLANNFALHNCSGAGGEMNHEEHEGTLRITNNELLHSSSTSCSFVFFVVHSSLALIPDSSSSCGASRLSSFCRALNTLQRAVSSVKSSTAAISRKDRSS